MDCSLKINIERIIEWSCHADWISEIKVKDGTNYYFQNIQFNFIVNIRTGANMYYFEECIFTKGLNFETAFRRYNICEERGSGFEKAVIAIELFGLPPLKFEELENSFKVTMFAPKKYADMTNEERIEACYQHSIIEYYGSCGFNNTSLRKRFGMHDKQAAQISLLIKEAIEAGRIKAKDPDNVSKKFSIYTPYWA